MNNNKTQAERLAAIEATLNIMVKRQEEDRVVNKENSNRVNKLCTDLGMELRRLAQDQKTTSVWRSQRVDPFIDMGTSIKARIAGAILALGILGGIFWAGIGFFKDKILEGFGG